MKKFSVFLISDIINDVVVAENLCEECVRLLMSRSRKRTYRQQTTDRSTIVSRREQMQKKSAFPSPKNKLFTNPLERLIACNKLRKIDFALSRWPATYLNNKVARETRPKRVFGQRQRVVSRCSPRKAINYRFHRPN
jgi:hypothetical protein